MDALTAEVVTEIIAASRFGLWMVRQEPSTYKRAEVADQGLGIIVSEFADAVILGDFDWARAALFVLIAVLRMKVFAYALQRKPQILQSNLARLNIFAAEARIELPNELIVNVKK